MSRDVALVLNSVDKARDVMDGSARRDRYSLATRKTWRAVLEAASRVRRAYVRYTSGPRTQKNTFADETAAIS